VRYSPLAAIRPRLSGAEGGDPRNDGYGDLWATIISVKGGEGDDWMRREIKLINIIS
jgi:hypothetical protein